MSYVKASKTLPFKRVEHRGQFVTNMTIFSRSEPRNADQPKDYNLIRLGKNCACTLDRKVLVYIPSDQKVYPIVQGPKQ